jgi:hypothetical protein
MMTKLLTYTLIMFSIFSCFRKKSTPNNIEGWLGQEFPGKYEVLVSNLKMLDIMAQFKGEKRALISEKADPEVQVLLDWQKDTVSLGLDPKEENCILSFQNEWRQDLNLSELTWDINPVSKRGVQYKEIAFEQAKVWAEKNLPKPCFMDAGQTLGFEFSKTGEEKGLQLPPKGRPAIRYAFPYFVKKPVDGTAGPKGYVKGIFTMDDQVFKTL